MTKPGEPKTKYPSTGIDYDLIFTRAREEGKPITLPAKTERQGTEQPQPKQEGEGERPRPTHIYSFKVATGGGTYITTAPTIEEARQELLHKWPDIISIEKLSK